MLGTAEEGALGYPAHRQGLASKRSLRLQMSRMFLRLAASQQSFTMTKKALTRWWEARLAV